MTAPKKAALKAVPEVTHVRLDTDSLTLGDLEAFEEAIGGDLMESLTPQIVRDDKGRPVPDPDDPKHRPLQRVNVSAKTMVGLVWIALRKDKPDLTLAEVKNMPLSSLDFDVEGAVKSPDPTEPPKELSGGSSD